MAEQPVLEFSNVNVRFEQTWALCDVSLILNPGETRIILGEAGSGKSTLLKTAIGLVTVDNGAVQLFGEQVANRKETDLFKIRSRAGFVFQEGGLFDSVSVGENVEYPLLNRQISEGKSGDETEETEKRVRDSLRFVEL